MFKKLSRIVTTHPTTILVSAGILLTAAVLFGTSVFGKLSAGGFYDTSSESYQTGQVLSEEFGHLSSDVVVLIEAQDGQTVKDVVYRSAVQSVAADLKDQPEVAEVQTYYTTGAENMVSRSGDASVATVKFKDDVERTGSVANRLRGEVTSDQLTLRFAGDRLLDYDVNIQIEHDLVIAETISFAVLSVLLLFVFRGVVAAGLPLLLGGFTILLSFLFLRGLSEVIDVSTYAINIIIALGLGLSIDYSLLMVARFREELERHKVKKALLETIRTAGHTVFFSGLTVIVSLLGLAIFPLGMLRSMGLGGAAAVVAALLAGLVVLPAILMLLGKNINRWSIRLRPQRVSPSKTGFWYRLTHVTMKRPLLFVIITTGLLLVAASPLLRFELDTIDERVLPASSVTRQTVEEIQSQFDRPFIGLQIVYQAPDLTSQEGVAALYDYTDAIAQLDAVDSVSGLTAVPDVTLSKAQYQALIANPTRAPANLQQYLENIVRGDKTIISIAHDESLTMTEKNALIDNIRAIPLVDGASVMLGGWTAMRSDQLESVAGALPIVIGWIALAIFIIVFLMTGSVLLPIKAMLLNGLSLAVAISAVVWIFQEGHLAGLFGFNADIGVNITQPLIIFAIAFGLSMDYSVFLYGRIKEEYDKLGDTKQAVASGLDKTGRTITAAAVLLFVVVAAFATSQVAIMQQIGVGLAVAVIVDAFVIRMILVPATMVFLGRWNWWAPRWMKRLHAKLGL